MKKTFLSILFVLAICMCLSPMALAAEPTPTDITATGLRLGRDADHPLPTEETVYKAGEGTVTYRPATESANAKLILDNATINGAGADDGFAIYLTLPANTKLDIELKGTNTLNSYLDIRGVWNEENSSYTPVDVSIQPAEGASNASLSVTYSNYSAAVFVFGKLTIQGSINVSVKNTYPTNIHGAYAFCSLGNMTIQNGATVTAESNDIAVFYVDSVLSVDNATVTATNNGDGDALKVYNQLAVSNNAAVTATSNGSGQAVYIIASQISGESPMGHALQIENGATLTATTKSGEAVHIGDCRTALVDNGTMNLAGGSSWFGWSTLTIQNSGKVTLASGSEMQITCDTYNGGSLTNNGIFENNGTLKFTGNAAPAASAIEELHLTGSGMVQLGADDENPTYYTNDGTAMQGGSSDLDLTALADSNDLATNGYTLATGEDGAKTLTLGSVRLGTITLPTNADTTIVLSGSAFVDTITGGGALTVQKTESVESAVLTVSEGITLGGNLTVGSGVALYATGINYGISFASGSRLTIENGGALTAKRASGTAPAIVGTVMLPADYYYRTAPSGSYLRGSLVACAPSSESYVELVITKPAGYAANKVNYMAWDATNKQLKPAQCEDPNTVASSSEVVVAWGESGKTTWYVVEDNVSISGKVTVNGDVHLILADGKTLTTKHIEIESGSLTVYGQSGQSGKLSATGTISSGIYVKNGTKLTVNGGVVEATGASTGNSVGIQLGENRSANGTMTVNSGMVKATGQPASSDGYSSTGIAVNGSGSLTINGGEVTATGGSVMQNASSYGVYLNGARTAMTMSGGTLTAKATSEGAKAVVVVQGKLNLPADYYWRTAAAGSYTRGKAYAYTPGSDSYVELTAGKPTGFVSKEVKYLDWNDTNKALEEKTFEDPIAVTADSTTLGESGKTTWYVVEDSVTISGKVTVNGDVHLILVDGKTLTTATVEINGSLTVYGQNGQSGKLVATDPRTGEISSGYGIYVSGGLIINGGVIEASAPNAEFGYGIYVNGALIINGGTVTATGGKTTVAENETTGKNYCGIYVYEGDITINGGEVTATGGKIQGEFEGYCDSHGMEVERGGITVTGGTVNATGGTVSITNTKESQINGQSRGIVMRSGTKLAVSGGTVTAIGSAVSVIGKNVRYGDSYGACIYGDVEVSSSGTLDCTGGTVTMSGKGRIGDDDGYSIQSDSSGLYVNEYDYEDENENTVYAGGAVTVSGGKLKAAGGNVSVTKTDAVAGNDWSDSSGLYVDNKLTVSGGTVELSHGTATLVGGANDRTYASDLVTDELAVNGGTMKLKDSSLGNPVTVSNGVKLADLLADGYAFWQSGENGGFVSLSEQTVLSNVTVKLCEEHSAKYGTCAYCGKDLGSAPSNSGGSSSGPSNPTVSTETTSTPDGSTVKTETKKDGTVVETVKSPDGSTTKTETKTETGKDGSTVETKKETVTGKDGSSSTTEIKTETKPDGSSTETKTETTKSPDGTKTETKTETKTDENGAASTTEVKKATASDGSSSTTTTVTDENGSTTTSNVSVGSKAAKDAQKSGEAVTLPVEVPAGKSGESSTTVQVDLPANSGALTVEIPVSNVTAGTVAILVNEDGTETILPLSKVTGNGIQLTLEESATIKIVDNSKSFGDVEQHDFFSAAVQWASSRGITDGIGGGQFGPDLSAARAQLVTFLWRAAGCPVVNFAMDFSDVDEAGFYGEAVRWAASLGIVGGYGDGTFGTNDAITREQMAVILYRFAQSVGMDTTLGGMAAREFADYDSISDYALDAMRWAVNAGIVQGADGKLMPNDTCTRGQIVTMLYRLLGK